MACYKLLEFKAAAFPIEIYVIFISRYDKNNIEVLFAKKSVIVNISFTYCSIVRSECLQFRRFAGRAPCG